MQLAELLAGIERVAPPVNAASWDRSGLQVACARSAVSRLAVCLDPTPESVRRALEARADCILSHHPLSLSPDLPRRQDAYWEVLRLLLGADVPLYAAHTTLDVNAAGPAAWLADEFGLLNRAVLEPVAPAPEHGKLPYGYGLAGDLPKPMAFEAFNALLSRLLDFQGGTVCGPVPGLVERVAYCTGSGSSLWREAGDAGARLFITGDVKYHTALETRIGILDVGHHSLEEEMMRRMALVLADMFAGLEVIFVASASPLRPRRVAGDAGAPAL
ncbi:MAG: Nif3-like dinuclear metal center hexameric protein [Desulfovibrio sp.]|nr:Nif3-like dinuclear metal center hexameric protein [Desulfovibrio sp.]